MCLTIPAKIIGLNKNLIIIQDRTKIKQIRADLISGLKIGDWVLYIDDQAIKKIPQKDAQEIINFLEAGRLHGRKIKLSEKFKKIIEVSHQRGLTKAEIIYLLKTEGNEKEVLFSEANTARQTYLKDFICIHGIIEFSNYCKNDCLYCGLRKQNTVLTRYRMTPNEIITTVVQAVKKKGYKLLVLQSGEDYFYTDEMLSEIVKKIKEKCRVFIFMSVGERGYECYKKMKQAGASGVLFRFETSNLELFKKMHPKGKSLQNRLEHLKFMKELGYFIATGSIIGLPEQKIEDLADDILMMKKWANMVSMGPFIPTAGTPLGQAQNSKLKTQNEQKVEMNLKMIAILRLLMPEARIPVVTALETLAGEDGRKKALLAGANSLMFNLTPAKYRPLYKIYDNKFYQKENLWEKYGLFKYEESYKMLEQRMRKEIKRPKS